MAPNMAFASHLKWMRQKYILRQDMFLIGDPGSIRRRLAYQFCRVEGLQPELLTITRDTVEADLRQRREIGKNGETIYVDSAVVRAAIMGRVLILDGIEKAERNVLPTINNLLENREMVLDDGRCLLSHIKYDKLTEDLGQAEVTARNLLRVSPRFIVVALGLPVPPCVGHTLDPPLRSRFQGRVIAGLSAEPQATPSLRDFVDAVVQSPELPLLPGDAMSGLQKAFTVTGDTYEAIARVYPWKLFPAEACRGVNSILASLGISQKSPKLGEAGSHISQETGFVTTPSVRKTIEDIGKDWRAGLDICLVGPAGCGKTQTMLHFIRSLKPSRDIETMFLYRDMSARDLLQRRVTDVATGATIWLPSSAVRAAVEGKSPDPSGSGLILTGAGNASVSGSETAGPRVIQVHPNFRVVALAAPPTQGNAWLSPEVMSLFSFHILGEASIAEIISAKYSGSGELALNVCDLVHAFFETIEAPFVPELLSLKQTLDGCQGIPPLTLRRMLRIAKICDSSPSKETLASTAWRQLLLNLVPPLEREALPKGFTRDFAAASSSLQEADGIEISLQDDAVVIDGIRGWMYRPGPDDNRPELIPQVRERFVLIPAHKRFMAEIHRDMFLHGERSLLIVGPQGVGKNMVIDYYMEMLRVERYYMQLHRDSTVGSLTSTPALHEGAIVWKESPLVTAAVEGRWIVLDEADKAPLEVVVLLKSLIEDGYLNLPDGRCLGGSGGTPIHPNFRCIVLCNRPGFPFLGNDFFRECGDIFSVFLMEIQTTTQSSCLYTPWHQKSYWGSIPSGIGLRRTAKVDN
ncbi:hypothetical protein Pmar_PMAR028153 [Perkinsus marinus ATCC 50983]|uniref:ATPase dynein-related AAA domain-containing protein n=1 Tax=Perkinsus marinus (strain ATCC 50983 / TXsc) TaxID=423536 RepID=C5LB40_PERM5|nr:hypothetical protein Pmar_PMAR028153 [Perkinsus marinus ATCC 50983]EER05968.1 hypothetical protein Pmar_PMAR028153 [Perkinsus marinus ATCC 50983]|eukprot:XP_002774152.1 hypothetical protein Pmar_PMAR028153 [Perkinsus marinus ATCC 50983]